MVVAYASCGKTGYVRRHVVELTPRQNNVDECITLNASIEIETLPVIRNSITPDPG